MEIYYCPDISQDNITLSQEESRHCLKVMHHRVGDMIMLTDGRGVEAEAMIVGADKTQCFLAIQKRKEGRGKRNFNLHIAVAPTKNKDRIEWFLEKAVEIGIEKVTLIICQHSERPRIDLQRLERIAVSAMKQSQSSYIPEITMMSFTEMLQQFGNDKAKKMVAWCSEDGTTEELAKTDLDNENIILLIGPEGDFSEQEITLAREYGFMDIRLGNKRLRTETAALYGCCVIAARKL